MPVHHGATARQEPLLRVFGVEPALERRAPRDQVALREGQRPTLGDAELQLHEVEAGHQLGDGMLHLQPRVDLEEVEGAVGRRDELHRAGVEVADGLARSDRGGAHLLAQLRREEDRGRLLDDLLVAALDGALALKQVHQVALPVAQNLDLDVAGLIHIALDDERIVTERAQRFALRAGYRLG